MPRILYGPWDGRRAWRFRGASIAFQVDGDPEWFAGKVDGLGRMVVVSGATDSAETMRVEWITKAVVLSDIP